MCWFLSETFRFFTVVYREALQPERRGCFFEVWQRRRFLSRHERVATPTGPRATAVLAHLDQEPFAHASWMRRQSLLSSSACQAREAQACLPISAHFSLIIAHTPGSASCWKMFSLCSGGYGI